MLVQVCFVHCEFLVDLIFGVVGLQIIKIRIKSRKIYNIIPQL